MLEKKGKLVMIMKVFFMMIISMGVVSMKQDLHSAELFLSGIILKAGLMNSKLNVQV